MNTAFITNRSRERTLIVVAQLIAFFGIMAVSLAAGKVDNQIIGPLGFLIVLWLVVHGLLCRFADGNQLLLPVTLMLSALGLIAVYRLKPELILSQILWNTIGIIAFTVTVFAFRRLEKLADVKYLIGMMGMGLLLAAILFGVDIGGNKNWVVLGSFRFQPSEFAKLFIVIFLAAYLTERREVLTYATRRLGPFALPKFRFAAPVLVFWGLTMLMLVFQRDLGTALLYYGTALAMIYVASNRFSYVFVGLILFITGAVLCYHFYPHVQTRINIWLNPWADPSGGAYQIVQSLFALGSGGMLGLGLGFGFPGLIPEVHTDFVFSAFAEEWGYLGSSAIVISYMMLLTISFLISLQATSPFRQLTVAGLAIFLGFQVLLIIGGVTKFMPLTGVTLPFISYGGSSLVSSYILVGILFAASIPGAGPKKNLMDKTIRITACIILGLLAILLTYIGCIQLISGNQLAAHPLNKRTAYLEKKMERGAILDRDGEKLAYSEQGSDRTWHREYPLGAIAAPVTGYKSSLYGLAGLEGKYNLFLSGLGNPENRLGTLGRLLQEQAGQIVTLTIDSDLQKTAYHALGNRRGAVVAIEPKTGAVLALVSRPSFDPSDIENTWKTIATSAASPLLNRAVQGLYPPGSVIKVLVAEAALSEKVVSPQKQFTCEGKLVLGKDYVLSEAGGKKHGTLDLEDALAVSCNVTFGQLALQLGRDALSRSYAKYGFTRPLEGDMASEPARLPDFSRLSDGDLAQAGIGQGSLLVTPLHMALMTAAFANRGTMMEPYLVQSIHSQRGSIIKDHHQPAVWLNPISPQMAETIGKMMVTTVNHGTASAARLSGIAVAGKTGTAENPHGEDHAWFIGFAPAEDPKIAIAVIVENSGSGGSVATPIGRQVIAQALR